MSHLACESADALETRVFHIENISLAKKSCRSIVGM